MFPRKKCLVCDDEVLKCDMMKHLESKHDCLLANVLCLSWPRSDTDAWIRQIVAQAYHFTFVEQTGSTGGSLPDFSNTFGQKASKRKSTGAEEQLTSIKEQYPSKSDNGKMKKRRTDESQVKVQKLHPTQLYEDEQKTVAGEVRIQCRECNEWIRPANRRPHVFRNHLEQCLFSCPLCSFGNDSSNNVSNHIRKTHGSQEKPVDHKSGLDDDIFQWLGRCFKVRAGLRPTYFRWAPSRASFEPSFQTGNSTEQKSFRRSADRIKVKLEDTVVKQEKPIIKKRHSSGNSKLGKLYEDEPQEINGEMKIQCRECEQWIKPQNRRPHVYKSHVKVSLFSCPNCSLESKSYHKLLTHMKWQHKDSEKTPISHIGEHDAEISMWIQRCYKIRPGCHPTDFRKPPSRHSRERSLQTIHDKQKLSQFKKSGERAKSVKPGNVGLKRRQTSGSSIFYEDEQREVNGEMMIQCRECEQWIRPRTRRPHIFSCHLDSHVFSCPHCSFGNSQEARVARHIDKEHKESVEKPVKTQNLDNHDDDISQWVQRCFKVRDGQHPADIRRAYSRMWFDHTSSSEQKKSTDSRKSSRIVAQKPKKGATARFKVKKIETTFIDRFNADEETRKRRAMAVEAKPVKLKRRAASTPCKLCGERVEVEKEKKRQHILVSHMGIEYLYECKQCEFRSLNHESVVRSHSKLKHNIDDIISLEDQLRQQIQHFNLKCFD